MDLTMFVLGHGGAERGDRCPHPPDPGAGGRQVLHDHVRQGELPEPEQQDELGDSPVVEGGEEGSAGGLWQRIHVEVGIVTEINWF